MTDAKSKGRPKGSEKNDDAALSAVADMIVINAGLRPTTAMRCFNKKATPSELRRWQAKWKERKEGYLADARLRVETKAREEVERRTASAQSSRPARIGHLAMLLDTPAMRIARGLDLSPAMKAIAAHQNSPSMRIVQQMENSHAFRIARELQNSHAARLMKEMDRLTRFGFR
ncbi:hypothetical protein [Sphingobium sp. YR768]|uniref:hypothetical protein n=1 Tax=Sphingobium sp. YR768 TaxID=1884365 RepID=UPI0008AFBD8E|nr:hypothetical protein [Sphingobium sp. YR768]SES21737.1 hypothetical protein SAMN05518866_1692 [Sphingobium sp. YR768]